MAEEAKNIETALVETVDKDREVVDAEFSMAETNPQFVKDTLEKINNMRAIVQKSLVKDHDYGVIPGCPKPSLWKPGAEKVLILFGLASEYELLDKVQDYDKGFFAFTFRCILTKNGQLVTQGVGTCNTKERKYIKQNAYNLANTVLKMAKKRAQVDATLTVASLSDIFTQDLEESEDEGDIPSERSKATDTLNADISTEDGDAFTPKTPEERMGVFNALKQRYIDVCGNVPHAENSMKKVKEVGGHQKITQEFLDALTEDVLVREHDKEAG